jgi:hypothetical protein
MASYKKQLIKALAAHGWEQLYVRVDDLEWWADESWTLHSIRESHGFEVIVTFVVNPGWEGPRKKGQGVYVISATAREPKTWPEAEGGLRLRMNEGRFDEKLAKFLQDLDRSRTFGSSAHVERLAWDVMRVRTRTDGEREKVARYIVDLIEAKAETRLVVGLRLGCEKDLLSGWVIQAEPAIVSEPLWTGLIMGNIVGDDEAVAYSVVLFPFANGLRVSRMEGNDAPLRSFTAMWEDAGVRVWATGRHDEWGEWAAMKQPLDVVGPGELSDEVREAIQRLGPKDRES